LRTMNNTTDAIVRAKASCDAAGAEPQTVEIQQATAANDAAAAWKSPKTSQNCANDAGTLFPRPALCSKRQGVTMHANIKPRAVAYKRPSTINGPAQYASSRRPIALKDSRSFAAFSAHSVEAVLCSTKTNDSKAKYCSMSPVLLRPLNVA